MVPLFSIIKAHKHFYIVDLPFFSMNLFDSLFLLLLTIINLVILIAYLSECLCIFSSLLPLFKVKTLIFAWTINKNSPPHIYIASKT